MFPYVSNRAFSRLQTENKISNELQVAFLSPKGAHTAAEEPVKSDFVGFFPEHFRLL